MSLKRSLPKSFSFAFEGIKTALLNEPNFKIHIILGLIALLFGLFLKLSATEMAILILTIGLVLILELINTMLEALVDLVSPEIKPQAKIAKDVSAAAVLISAIIAVGVGALLFLPKILL